MNDDTSIRSGNERFNDSRRKIARAVSVLFASSIVFTSYACSSSSGGSGGGGGTVEDAGGAAQDDGGATQDSGSSTEHDSGGSQPQCGTGTFTCATSSGSDTCAIGTEYCASGSGCSPYTGSDPCPNCANPPGECGIGKTLTCTGNSSSGVTVSCD